MKAKATTAKPIAVPRYIRRFTGPLHSKNKAVRNSSTTDVAITCSCEGTPKLKLSFSQVLADYMVSPTTMSMNMHMAEVMYGLTDSLTLMAMMSYVQLEMDHVTRMGMRFTTQSEGLSDIQLMAHWAFYESKRHRFIYFEGLGLPTGFDRGEGKHANGQCDSSLSDAARLRHL